MIDSRKPLLTDGELKIMHTIWPMGTGTVKNVHSAMLPRYQFAITTVATVLKILQRKGFVCHELIGRTLVYSPTVSLGEYQAVAVAELVRTHFAGSTEATIERCFETFDFSEEELEGFAKLISS